MLTIEREQKRQALQAELVKADDQVFQTLLADAAQFRSPVQMREHLNQARETREWAARKLAELDQVEAGQAEAIS